ncbi:MAG: Crp/Fnr family transcriptional regulator [Deltaproteobacteria bacterium]|nr:Crp/Fnr family transcriptional regulator [Deltaproteobacteria bacterium]
MAVTKSLKKGDILFNEGDRSAAMYFVQSGTLRLYKKKGASSIELGTVHTGEVIGEMGFLDGGPRSASAEAILDTELVEINGANMAAPMKDLPPWLMVLLKTIVNRLRSANNKIRQLELAGSVLDYSGGGPTARQYEFLSVHDVLKVCTAVLLVGARNGERAQVLDGPHSPLRQPDHERTAREDHRDARHPRASGPRENRPHGSR